MVEYTQVVGVSWPKVRVRDGMSSRGKVIISTNCEENEMDWSSWKCQICTVGGAEEYNLTKSEGNDPLR